MKTHNLQKTILWVLFIIVQSTATFCQVNDNWFLGIGKTYNFKTQKFNFSNNQIYCEGLFSTISDKNGELLFFSNGGSLYDKNGNITPNGNDIKGDSLSTHMPALIIQHPNQKNIYYLFSLTSYYSEFAKHKGELYYSIIDATLNNGLGDIVADKKNILLGDEFTEVMVCAPGHCNNMWLVLHKANSSDFYSYEISNNEILLPIISNVGTSIKKDTKRHEITLKFAPNYEKLILENNTTLEYFNFNRANGKISNPIQIPTSKVGSKLLLEANFIHDEYNILTFENNSPKLDINSIGEDAKIAVFKFDINTKKRTFIDSIINIGTVRNANIDFNKILIIGNSYDLSILTLDKNQLNIEKIHDGNYGYVTLNNPTANYINTFSIFESTDTASCNNEIKLYVNQKYDEIIWNSRLFKDTLTVTASGKQSVEIVTENCLWFDSITVDIIDFSAFNQNDTTFCVQKPKLVSLIDFDGTVEWFNGYNETEVSIREPGEYSYKLNKKGCEWVDTFNVEIIDCDTCVLGIPNIVNLSHSSKNNVLQFHSNCSIESFECHIFDRWGSLIAQFDDVNQPWDGIYNKNKMDSNVFILVGSYYDETLGVLKKFTETVTVIN